MAKLVFDTKRRQEYRAQGYENGFFFHLPRNPIALLLRHQLAYRFVELTV
jgi:hypothetical protein